MNKKLKFQLLAVAMVILVAGLGSVFVSLGMDWFGGLSKPTQWIPNIVIPIVWTIVYALTGVILWMLIKNNQMSTKLLVLFVLNGILNVLWCLTFFALNLTLIGNIIIIINLIAGWLLWVTLIQNKTILNYLYIIYPLWLSIATTLNLCLWILN